LIEGDYKWPEFSTPTLTLLTPNRRKDTQWFEESRDGVQDTGFGVRHTGADEYSCKLLCKSTVSDPVEAASTKPTVFGLSVRTLRWLCHLSHLLLVALHLILVAVHVSRLDHNVVMPIIHSWLPTVVSVSLQAYYTIYSTFLVTLTQRLGLLRALHRRQKLTFIADASTAWSGFGSALIGLRNNFHVLAGFLSTAIITAYLAHSTRPCTQTSHRAWAGQVRSQISLK